MQFDVQKNVQHGVVIIQTPERFTIECSDDFKKIMTGHVENNEFKFVIDLSETAYMDSSGLGAIVSRIAQCRSNKGDIRLANPTANVKDLLELTNLNKILSSFKTVKQALESFTN